MNNGEGLSSIVYDLQASADGSVWAALLSAGLVRYEGDKAEIITLDTDSYMSIDCMHIGDDGSIWLANWGDIIHVKDGEWETFSGDYTQDTDTTRIIQGPDGTIWCGGFMGGLAGYQNGEWTVLMTDDWLPDNEISKVVADSTGGLWILSATTITYYDGFTAQVYPTNWKTMDLLIAPDQSVWVSLGNNGVYRFDGLAWAFYGPGDSQDGFEDNSFGAMLEDMEEFMGDEFAGMFGDMITEDLEEMDASGWDDGSQGDALVTVVETQNPSGIEPNQWYISLSMTPDGRLLCVSAEETVHSLSVSSWSVYAIPGDSAADIALSSQGAYWLSCPNGLYRSTDGKNWKAYPEIIDSDYHIYHHGNLHITPDDSCWIASLSGVACQPADGDSFYFRLGDGIPQQNIACITSTPDGTIWIGTAAMSLENGSGAAWHDGTWHILTAADGLASNAVHDIFADTETIWFGTQGGISQYRPQETP